MRNHKTVPAVKKPGGLPSQDLYDAQRAKTRGERWRRENYEKDLELLKNTSLKDLIK